MDPRLSELLDAAARPYRAAGRYGWHSARGKLRHDPAYFSFLQRGLLPDEGQLLDVGCGQGLLLSLLVAAREQHSAGRWPGDWPPPPTRLLLRGVDANARRVELARRALGSSARVDLSDLGAVDFGSCTAIVMLDVLLYLPPAEQDAALDRAAAALAPGGLLLLREPDADAGFAFHATKLSAWFDAASRARFPAKLHCRGATRWAAAVQRRGFAVDAAPMSRGTPFCNVLFVAKKVV